MSLYDYVYGYFLLKGAILGGYESPTDFNDEYCAGVHEAYNAMKEVLFNYEKNVIDRGHNSAIFKDNGDGTLSKKED